MSGILIPGYLCWDGYKYILNPDINRAFIFNNSYRIFFDGTFFHKINI